jgi:anaerobic magnesium-protoporphyrin IX monomethyl ester cyclase
MEPLGKGQPVIPDDLRHNLGTRAVKPLKLAQFPDAGGAVRQIRRSRPATAVDVLLVNPPSPDGGIWIRTQHRVGRRSREEMVWPQCSLAQLAAMLSPAYSVAVIDAIAERMSWADFEAILRQKCPKYYLTHATAPTLTNDMYGVMLAKSIGSSTIAFGTHVTPMPLETMRDYPALDYVLRGEPELTLCELIDWLEGGRAERPEWLVGLFREADPSWSPQSAVSEGPAAHGLEAVKGLVWRDNGDIRVNPDRPFIRDLNKLPIPMYHLLPLHEYRMPLMKGPFCFVLTSRGCPAGCKYCIKHVSYQSSVRLLSPERVLSELRVLYDLGIRNIHMYADLFTVNREQVVGICNEILSHGLKIKWTCNSRVDFVDEEMLTLMGRAGCWMISWGIESGNEALLRKAAKGADPKKAKQALRWARAAGIKNWGYFIIGLPGETVDTIQETIALSKELPLELALFHVAAPYPGTPFFFEVIEKGWFKEGTKWEEVDMDKDTVLQYDNLSAEDLLYWQRRAFREWAFRWRPALTYATMLLSDYRTLRRALRVGMEHFAWAARAGRPRKKMSEPRVQARALVGSEPVSRT